MDDDIVYIVMWARLDAMGHDGPTAHMPDATMAPRYTVDGASARDMSDLRFYSSFKLFQ